jgi:hypothetical protein
MRIFNQKNTSQRAGFLGVVIFAVLLLSACSAANAPAAPAAPAALGATISPVSVPPAVAPVIAPAPSPAPAMDSPIQPLQPPESQPAEEPALNPRDPKSLLITPQPTTVPMATDATAQAEALKNPAVQASVDVLAKLLNVPPSSITVVSVEAIDWPDGCLGVRIPDTMCTMMIVPGYRVVLEAGGQQYEYHTDLSGRQAILANPR